MRKYILLWAMISSLCFFTACDDDDTEDISVEYSLDLTKGTRLISQLDDPYSEPGYKATYNGTDVTADVVVEGSVDINTVGLYTFTYTYTIPNGESISLDREVIVADMSITTDITGTYIVQEGTHRIRQGVRTDYKDNEVVIKKIAPGFFSVSNFLGGYYSHLPNNYGTRYAMTGNIQLKEDNTIAELSSFVAGWGMSLSGLENAIYNPDDETISWEAGFAGMAFNVIMKKKEE